MQCAVLRFQLGNPYETLSAWQIAELFLGMPRGSYLRGGQEPARGARKCHSAKAFSPRGNAILTPLSKLRDVATICNGCKKYQS